MFKDWKKGHWAGAAAVLLLFFGIPFLNWASSRFRRPPTSEERVPKRASLEGKLVCLPRPEGYPSDLSCPLAIRLDDGRRYLLEFSLMSSVPEAHEEGDRVSAAGVLIPAERGGKDREVDDKTAGIFAVTDSFKVIE